MIFLKSKFQNNSFTKRVLSFLFVIFILWNIYNISSVYYLSKKKVRLKVENALDKIDFIVNNVFFTTIKVMQTFAESMNPEISHDGNKILDLLNSIFIDHSLQNIWRNVLWVDEEGQVTSKSLDDVFSPKVPSVYCYLMQAKLGAGKPTIGIAVKALTADGLLIPVAISVQHHYKRHLGTIITLIDASELNNYIKGFFSPNDLQYWLIDRDLNQISSHEYDEFMQHKMHDKFLKFQSIIKDYDRYRFDGVEDKFINLKGEMIFFNKLMWHPFFLFIVPQHKFIIDFFKNHLLSSTIYLLIAFSCFSIVFAIYVNQYNNMFCILEDFFNDFKKQQKANNKFRHYKSPDLYKIKSSLYECNLIKNIIDAFIFEIHSLNNQFCISIQKTIEAEKKRRNVYFLLSKALKIMYEFEVKLESKNACEKITYDKMEFYKTLCEKNMKTIQLKSDFLAMISHEIRTPLNAIVGFIDLLFYQNKIISETEKEYMLCIKKASNLLLRLADELLDVSRIEIGAIDINNEFVQVKPLIDFCVSCFFIDNNKHNIYVDISNDIPRIIVDHTRITQILLNVIGNALKFAKNVWISAKFVDKELYIIVKDDGVGISKHDLLVIGEKYTQLNNHIDGYGLGLAIVKKLIKLHGGFIKIDSELGKGSKVIVVIPKERVEQMYIELT